MVEGICRPSCACACACMRTCTSGTTPGGGPCLRTRDGPPAHSSSSVHCAPPQAQARPCLPLKLRALPCAQAIVNVARQQQHSLYCKPEGRVTSSLDSMSFAQASSHSTCSRFAAWDVHRVVCQEGGLGRLAREL